MSYDIEVLGEIGPVRQDIYLERDGFSLPMNIYMPESFGAKRNGTGCAVIAIHGGSWYSPLKRDEPFSESWMAHNCRYLASRGFVALEISYRSISVAPLTETVKDVLEALCYLENNLSSELGIDKTVVIGDSAGGHLALTTALLAEKSKTLSGAVACNPITDCVNTQWTAGLETDRERKSVSPIHLARRLPFPIAIIHGDADTTVDYNDSVKFCHVMKQLGCDVALLTLPGASHAFILYNYTTPKEKVDEYNSLLCDVITDMAKAK